jgi:toxin FitB
LDTCVLSELRRPRPEPQVADFVKSQALDALFVSVVTVSELRFGIETVEDPARRSELADWLEHRVRPQFQGRVLPVDEEVMLRWRILVEAGRKAGHTYSQPDLIIAATALCFGLTVVTRNSSDFEMSGADLLDPWKTDGRPLSA